MKKLFLFSLFVITASAFADRDLYTCEIVGDATVIGIWKSEDVAKRNFKNPVKMFKGKAVELEGTNFRQDEFNHMLNSKKKQFLIAFRKYKNGGCYVRHLDAKLVPEINILLNQFKEMKKWQTYSVKEQIFKSTLIIRGQIKDSGKTCPTLHFFNPGKAFKGKILKDKSVYPVDVKLLNKESIIFLQKLPGNGPEYRVMNSVPVKDAAEYLKILK